MSDAATTARAGADYIRLNERSWKDLKDRARQFGIQSGESKQICKSSCEVVHPELDEVFSSITEWAHENFAKLLYQFDDRMKDFKFVRVSEVSKVWKENDLWLTDALLEYEFGGAKKRNVSFQTDNYGKILGFNLFEPVKG